MITSARLYAYVQDFVTGKNFSLISVVPEYTHSRYFITVVPSHKFGQLSWKCGKQAVYTSSVSDILRCCDFP